MRRHLSRIFRIREAGIIVALALIIAVTALLNSRFLSSMNLQILSRQIAIFGIIPFPVLILAFVAGTSIFILRYTPLGRHSMQHRTDVS